MDEDECTELPLSELGIESEGIASLLPEDLRAVEVARRPDFFAALFFAALFFTALFFAALFFAALFFAPARLILRAGAAFLAFFAFLAFDFAFFAFFAMIASRSVAGQV